MRMLRPKEELALTMGNVVIMMHPDQVWFEESDEKGISTIAHNDIVITMDGQIAKRFFDERKMKK